MSESAGIPEDISREAYLIVRDLSSLTIYAGREAWENIVARAILAERERCCRLVFGHCDSDNVAQRTVAAIRRPSGDDS